MCIFMIYAEIPSPLLVLQPLSFHNHSFHSKMSVRRLRKRRKEMNLLNQLPGQITDLIDEHKNQSNTTYLHLIRDGGYIPSDDNVLNDAIVALSQGKNILLKGPTGSGKTKMAETLSSLFNQPMFSVNCSVDLDAESFLGFKTINYKDGQQVIDFVPGPLTEAMNHGHFLYIDEINMAKPETDRKSTRLNSSHVAISYAVFCL